MQRNEVVELRPAFLSLAIDVVFRYCTSQQPYPLLVLTHHRCLARMLELYCWSFNNRVL